MFARLKNRVANSIRQLGDNPKHASRAALACFLIIGLVASLLEYGPQLTPEFFQGRLLEPLTEAEESDFRDKTTNNGVPVMENAVSRRIQTCKSWQLGGDADKLLSRFELSFGGILPGAGNFLLEHPAMVRDRKEMLIYTFMKEYAKKQFCIEESDFKAVYKSGYAKLFSSIQDYATAQASIQTNIAPENVTLLNLDFAQKNKTAERNLVDTQGYIAEIIESAIESAIELDRQTQLKVSNLSSQTQSKLLDDIGKRQNTQIEIGNNIAVLSQEMRDQDASETPYGGTTNKITTPDAYQGQILDSGLPTNGSNFDSSASSMIMPRVSYGLLNLVNDNVRAEFINSRFAIESAFYLASIYWFDPLMPEGGNLVAHASTQRIQEGSYTAQLCKLSASDAATGCFDRDTNSEGESAVINVSTPSSSSTIPGSATPAPTGAPMNAFPAEWDKTPLPINIKQQTLPKVIVDEFPGGSVKVNF